MARSEAPSDAAARSHRLNLIKQLRLGLAGTYYSMAHTLGLRRIQDFLQVFTCWRHLPVCKCVLGSSAPSRAHIVGVCADAPLLVWNVLPSPGHPHLNPIATSALNVVARRCGWLLFCCCDSDRTSATFNIMASKPL